MNSPVTTSPDIGRHADNTWVAVWVVLEAIAWASVICYAAFGGRG
jgi:hypothetical protein